MQEKLQIQIWSTSSNRKSKPPHPICSTASWTCHFKRFLSHLLWVFLGGVWTLITHGHHWQNRLFLYFSCNSLLYNRKLHVLLCLLLRRLKNCTWFILPPEDVSYASAHPRWLCPDSEESKPSSKGDCSHGVQCSSRETDNAKLRIRLTLLILMATLFLPVHSSGRITFWSVWYFQIKNMQILFCRTAIIYLWVSVMPFHLHWFSPFSLQIMLPV